MSALTAASSIPSTLQASVIPLLVPSRCYTTRSTENTDAKSKLKFGVVFATMEQQVLYLGRRKTAYRGSAARQSIDAGQVCCVSSSDR